MHLVYATLRIGIVTEHVRVETDHLDATLRRLASEGYKVTKVRKAKK